MNMVATIGGGGKEKGRSGNKGARAGDREGGCSKGEFPFKMNGVTSSSFFSSPKSFSSSSISSSLSPDHHLWISSLIWPDIPVDISISCISINPKGTFLATGTHTGHIYLWHLKSLHAAISATAPTEGKGEVGGFSGYRRILLSSLSSSSSSSSSFSPSEVHTFVGKKSSLTGLLKEKETTWVCENLSGKSQDAEKEKKGGEKKKKNGEKEKCEEGYQDEEEESRQARHCRGGERRVGEGGLDDPLVIPSEGSIEEEEVEKDADTQHLRCSFHHSPSSPPRDMRKTAIPPDLSHSGNHRQPCRPHHFSPVSHPSSSSSFALPLPFLPHMILVSDWGGAAALIECGFGLSSSSLLQASSEEVLVSIHSDNKLRIWSLLEGRCLSVTKHFPFPLLSMRILSDRRYVLLHGSTGVFIFDLWCRCRVCYLSLSSLSCLRHSSHISPSTSFQRSFSEPFLSPIDPSTPTTSSTPPFSKDSRRGDRGGIERREFGHSYSLKSSSSSPSNGYEGSFQNSQKQQQEHPQQWPFLSLVSCSTNSPPDCSVHTVERLRSFFPDFLLPPLHSSSSSSLHHNTPPSHARSFEKAGEDERRKDVRNQEEEELDTLLQQYYSQQNATPVSSDPSSSSFLPSILEQPIVVAGVTPEGRVAIWDLRPVLLLWEQQQRELDHLGGASLFHGGKREYVVFSHLVVDGPRRRKARAQSSPTSHHRATTVDSGYRKNAAETEVQREGRGGGRGEEEREGKIATEKSGGRGVVAVAGEGVHRLGGGSRTRLRKHSLNAGGRYDDGVASPLKGRKQGGGKGGEEDDGILGPGSAVLQPMRTMFGGMFRAGGGGGTSTEEAEEEEDNNSNSGGLNTNPPRGVEPIYLSPVCCPENFMVEVGGSGVSSQLAVTTSYVSVLTPHRLLVYHRRNCDQLSSFSSIFLSPLYELYLSIPAAPLYSSFPPSFVPTLGESFSSSRHTNLNEDASFSSSSFSSSSFSSSSSPFVNSQPQKRSPPHPSPETCKEGSFIPWIGMHILPYSPSLSTLLQTYSSYSPSVSKEVKSRQEVTSSSSSSSLPPSLLESRQLHGLLRSNEKEKLRFASEAPSEKTAYKREEAVERSPYKHDNNDVLRKNRNIETSESFLLAWRADGSVYAFPLPLVLHGRGESEEEGRRRMLFSSSSYSLDGYQEKPIGTFSEREKGGQGRHAAIHLGYIPDALLGGEDTPTPIFLPLSSSSSSSSSIPSSNPPSLPNSHDSHIETLKNPSSSSLGGLLMIGVSLKCPERVTMGSWRTSSITSLPSSSSSSPPQVCQSHHHHVQGRSTSSILIHHALSEEEKKYPSPGYAFSSSSSSSSAFPSLHSQQQGAAASHAPLAGHARFSGERGGEENEERRRDWRSIQFSLHTSFNLRNLWRLPSILKPSLERTLHPPHLPTCLEDLFSSSSSSCQGGKIEDSPKKDTRGGSLMYRKYLSFIQYFLHYLEFTHTDSLHDAFIQESLVPALFSHLFPACDFSSPPPEKASKDKEGEAEEDEIERDSLKLSQGEERLRKGVVNEESMREGKEKKPEKPYRRVHENESDHREASATSHKTTKKKMSRHDGDHHVLTWCLVESNGRVFLISSFSDGSAQALCVNHITSRIRRALHLHPLPRHASSPCRKTLPTGSPHNKKISDCSDHEKVNSNKQKKTSHGGLPRDGDALLLPPLGDLKNAGVPRPIQGEEASSSSFSKGEREKRKIEPSRREIVDEERPSSSSLKEQESERGSCLYLRDNDKMKMEKGHDNEEEVDNAEDEDEEEEDVFYLNGEPVVSPWPRALHLLPSLIELPTPAKHPDFLTTFFDELASYVDLERNRHDVTQAQAKRKKDKKREMKRRTQVKNTREKGGGGGRGGEEDREWMHPSEVAESVLSLSSRERQMNQKDKKSMDEKEGEERKKVRDEKDLWSSKSRCEEEEEEGEGEEVLPSTVDPLSYRSSSNLSSSSSSLVSTKRSLSLGGSSTTKPSATFLSEDEETPSLLSSSFSSSSSYSSYSSTSPSSSSSPSSSEHSSSSAPPSDSDEDELEDKEHSDSSLCPSTSSRFPSSSSPSHKKISPSSSSCTRSTSSSSGFLSRKPFPFHSSSVYTSPSYIFPTQITHFCSLNTSLLAGGTNRGDIVFWRIPSFTVCGYLPRVMYGPVTCMMRVLSVYGGEGETQFDSTCFLVADISHQLTLIDAAKCCGCTDTSSGNQQTHPHHSSLYHGGHHSNPTNSSNSYAPPPEGAGRGRGGGGDVSVQQNRQGQTGNADHSSSSYNSSNSSSSSGKEPCAQGSSSFLGNVSTKGLVESPMYIHYRSSTWSVRTPQLLAAVPRPCNWSGVFPLERILQKDERGLFFYQSHGRKGEEVIGDGSSSSSSFSPISSSSCRSVLCPRSIRKVAIDMLSDTVCCMTASSHYYLWKIQTGRLLKGGSLSQIPGVFTPDVQNAESVYSRMFLQNPLLYSSSPHLEMTGFGVALGSLQLPSSSCCPCCSSSSSSFSSSSTPPVCTLHHTCTCQKTPSLAAKKMTKKKIIGANQKSPSACRPLHLPQHVPISTSHFPHESSSSFSSGPCSFHPCPLREDEEERNRSSFSSSSFISSLESHQTLPSAAVLLLPLSQFLQSSSPPLVPSSSSSQRGGGMDGMKKSLTSVLPPHALGLCSFFFPFGLSYVADEAVQQCFSFIVAPSSLPVVQGVIGADLSISFPLPFLLLYGHLYDWYRQSLHSSFSSSSACLSGERCACTCPRGECERERKQEMSFEEEERKERDRGGSQLKIGETCCLNSFYLRVRDVCSHFERQEDKEIFGHRRTCFERTTAISPSTCHHSSLPSFSSCSSSSSTIMNFPPSSSSCSCPSSSSSSVSFCCFVPRSDRCFSLDHFLEILAAKDLAVLAHTASRDSRSSPAFQDDISPLLHLHRDLRLLSLQQKPSLATGQKSESFYDNSLPRSLAASNTPASLRGGGDGETQSTKRDLLPPTAISSPSSSSNVYASIVASLREKLPRLSQYPLVLRALFHTGPPTFTSQFQLYLKKTSFASSLSSSFSKRSVRRSFNSNHLFKKDKVGFVDEDEGFDHDQEEEGEQGGREKREGRRKVITGVESLELCGLPYRLSQCSLRDLRMCTSSSFSSSSPSSSSSFFYTSSFSSFPPLALSYEGLTDLVGGGGRASYPPSPHTPGRCRPIHEAYSSSSSSSSSYVQSYHNNPLLTSRVDGETCSSLSSHLSGRGEDDALGARGDYRLSRSLQESRGRIDARSFSHDEGGSSSLHEREGEGFIFGSFLGTSPSAFLSTFSLSRSVPSSSSFLSPSSSSSASSSALSCSGYDERIRNAAERRLWGILNERISESAVAVNPRYQLLQLQNRERYLRHQFLTLQSSHSHLGREIAILINRQAVIRGPSQGVHASKQQHQQKEILEKREESAEEGTGERRGVEGEEQKIRMKGKTFEGGFLSTQEGEVVEKEQDKREQGHREKEHEGDLQAEEEEEEQQQRGVHTPEMKQRHMIRIRHQLENLHEQLEQIRHLQGYLNSLLLNDSKSTNRESINSTGGGGGRLYIIRGGTRLVNMTLFVSDPREDRLDISLLKNLSPHNSLHSSYISKEDEEKEATSTPSRQDSSHRSLQEKKHMGSSLRQSESSQKKRRETTSLIRSSTERSLWVRPLHFSRFSARPLGDRGTARDREERSALTLANPRRNSSSGASKESSFSSSRHLLHTSPPPSFLGKTVMFGGWPLQRFVLCKDTSLSSSPCGDVLRFSSGVISSPHLTGLVALSFTCLLTAALLPSLTPPPPSASSRALLIEMFYDAFSLDFFSQKTFLNFGSLSSSSSGVAREGQVGSSGVDREKKIVEEVEERQESGTEGERRLDEGREEDLERRGNRPWEKDENERKMKGCHKIRIDGESIVSSLMTLTDQCSSPSRTPTTERKKKNSSSSFSPSLLLSWNRSSFDKPISVPPSLWLLAQCLVKNLSSSPPPLSRLSTTASHHPCHPPQTGAAVYVHLGACQVLRHLICRMDKKQLLPYIDLSLHILVSSDHICDLVAASSSSALASTRGEGAGLREGEEAIPTQQQGSGVTIAGFLSFASSSSSDLSSSSLFSGLLHTTRGRRGGSPTMKRGLSCEEIVGEEIADLPPNLLHDFDQDARVDTALALMSLILYERPDLC
ncbi:wd g-beta repeat-containing, partial [Cystoisospora suis]